MAHRSRRLPHRTGPVAFRPRRRAHERRLRPTGATRRRATGTVARSPGTSPLCRLGSEGPRPVDVGAVLDRYDGDLALGAVDAVDHAVIASAGAVQALKSQ